MQETSNNLDDINWRSQFDNVKKPIHYANKKVEVIDYIKDTMTAEQYQGYCLGNVIKYASRYQNKNGIEDLRKAQTYLQWLIEALNNKEV
jgi:hypothetical protein